MSKAERALLAGVLLAAVVGMVTAAALGVQPVVLAGALIAQFMAWFGQ